MKPLHIACSPLSGNIYAGRVNKAGNAFTSKQDVTNAVCGAVAEKALMEGGTITIYMNGKPWAEISVRGGEAVTLPFDVARCPGVSYTDEDGTDWREGCEDCRRRTEPGHPRWQSHMSPPEIIVFECEYRIAP